MYLWINHLSTKIVKVSKDDVYTDFFQYIN